ncbi:MAG: hypothetical protein PHP03_00160 [Candidatus Pacebacteria bacterium]|nr:hypothetical protein [Candidatus Paceibacterota bacterium]
MAILVEEKKSFNWTSLLIVVLIFAFAFGVIYFLLLAPKPGVEIVVPSDQKLTSELSKISFDPASLSESDAFKQLKEYTGVPVTGNIGKSNPFAR